MILHLSVWIPPQSLLTLPKIIRNPLYQKSSSRIISHLPILTVNLVCIPLPIKPMRKNTNSIGATKTMSLWTVFQGFPFMKSLRLLRSPIPLSLLIFWQILIHFLPITECTFLADKGYDVKNIYNQVSHLYNGECIIPLNKRNTQNPKLLPQGNPICEAGLAMWKDGKFSDRRRTRQKFCCPLKNSKSGICPCHHKNFYNGEEASWLHEIHYTP